MKTRPQLEVSSNSLEMPGIKPVNLVYKASGLSTTPKWLLSYHSNHDFCLTNKNELNLSRFMRTKINQDALSSINSELEVG